MMNGSRPNIPVWSLECEQYARAFYISAIYQVFRPGVSGCNRDPKGTS